MHTAVVGAARTRGAAAPGTLTLCRPTLQPGTPSVLDTLRRETRDAHERLEAGLPLLDPGLDRGRYRALVERFWGFCHPAEAAVEASGIWAELGVDGAPRARLRWLERDLLALGHTPATLAALPRHPPLAEVRDPPGVAGYLYVMEGATLGGRLISRHLERTIGIGVSSGGSYFASYGPHLGPMWKAFTAGVAAYAERTGTEDGIVQGACVTFSSLERWLLSDPE